MSAPSLSLLSTVHTPEAILAQPRFAAARAAFVDAVLALHEGDQFSSRLLAETMRQITFNLIVSLHLRHDESDRSTWPTPRRLKDEIRTFGLASDRRIDALVSRLVQRGYVQSRLSEEDGRVRLLTPTGKMMSLDREWLYYHHLPLHVLFPDSYAEPIARDPLIKLIQMQMSAGDSEKGLSYTDIGVRFGISRTHVRGLLEEAAQHGDVTLSGRGGRLVALQPSILQALGPFLADAMSGHDLLYKFARERMAKEA